MIKESVITEGEIYFLRETDVLTGEKSPYVKIGLVEFSRESNQRKREHQTGNPRDLVIVNHFKTECVRAVEKILHWRYIKHGVRGEWFKFSDEMLDGAIKYAEELRDTFAGRITTLREGFRLQSIVSDGRTIPATDEARKWLLEYQVAHLIVGNTKKAHDDFIDVLKKLDRLGEDVSIVVSIDTRSSTRLIEKDLVDGDTDLYNKYCFEDIKSKFDPTRASATAKSDPRVVQAEELSSKLRQAITDMEEKRLDFVLVSQIAFEVDSTTKFYEKEKELAQLELQALCELAEKIEGICTWKRELDLVFDSALFKKEQIEIWNKYSVVGKAKVVKPVKPKTS